jgi:hypothetical protein
MPFLRSFHHDNRADHLGGCHYVEVQRLAASRRREDWRVSERRLQPVERILGLDSPREALVLLQESVEGQTLFTEPRDGMVQGGQAAQHLLHPL